jgi:hypothetical protein
MAAHLFEGKPDARQSNDTAEPTSRFRRRYRALSEDELKLHDAIKTAAEALERLYGQIPHGRYQALALTALEESVFWAVKAVTA